MPDLVLIPVGADLIALDRETFDAARERARSLLPSPATSDIPRAEILDADQIAERTGIPASWFLDAARQSRIPHIRAGKYVRFDLARTLEALAVARREGG